MAVRQQAVGFPAVPRHHSAGDPFLSFRFGVFERFRRIRGLAAESGKAGIRQEYGCRRSFEIAADDIFIRRSEAAVDVADAVFDVRPVPAVGDFHHAVGKIAPGRSFR